MKRFAFFAYGLFAHVMFLGVFAYMMAFVGGVFVPKTIDAPVSTLPLGAALAINLGLVGLFGVQHSVMARQGFKRWWTRIIPAPIERSTYVMISNVLVIAMMLFWQPIDIVVWEVQSPLLRGMIWGAFVAGWLLIPAASLLINHFDLFGTRQVWLHLKQQDYSPLPFRTPMLYKLVRHPLYVGWIIAFWAIPTMTAGHLLFAATLTAYMLVAIRLEERDLVAHYGESYAEYRRRVPMLIPRRGVAVRDERDLIPGYREGFEVQSVN